MTSKQIEYVLVLAETRSFSKLQKSYMLCYFTTYNCYDRKKDIKMTTTPFFSS